MIEKIDHPIFVIGRQFGSGGRLIGKALANRLGYGYYDKELLEETAVKAGLSREMLKSSDEHKPSFLSCLPGMFFGSYNYSNPDSYHDKLYKITSMTIEDVAQRGPCIIVGRTADYILRDCPTMRSLFLHAPIEKRAARIVERGDCRDIREAVDMARQRDHLRSKYYNYYTGRRWGKGDNYHLCLDASILSTDEIVDIIIRLGCPGHSLDK